MSERFDKFAAITLKHEGGYVNDPADVGGETNFGISRKFLDRKGFPDEDIKGMTLERAKYFYKEFFWSDYIDIIDNDLTALMLFDFGVNAGWKRAAKCLQKAVGTNPDGLIGPITLAAVQQLSPNMTQRKFLREIMLYYVGLAQKKRSTYIKFLRNWTLRAFGNFTLEKNQIV